MAVAPTPLADPWPRLYADVKIDIPGVTDAVFKQVLFRTWKDFCDKSNIWVEEVPVEVNPDELSYPFPVNNKGTPNRLQLVYDPLAANPDRKWVQNNISMTVPGIITLWYKPSSVATWNVVVSKTPIEPTDDDNYPDLIPEDRWIIDKYRDALYFGVLGRLQMSPNKPYSNAKNAGYNLQNYRVELGKARTDAIKANVLGGQRWMYPQAFAAVARKGWT